ncbi:hypothetical protein ACHAXR_009797 [Thalassiosira sp. AJA248-18]
MEYYLRTGHGESDNYYGGKEDPKQGLGQGNGAAPPTWLQIRSLLIRVQRRNRHGITIRSPISKKQIHQVGIIYVDNTNLRAGMEEEDDLHTTTYKAQEGANQRGSSLKDTGGGLNSIKCFSTDPMVKVAGDMWTNRSMNMILKKSNIYKKREELDGLPLTVPTDHSDAVTINRLTSAGAVENLFFSRSDGDNTPHLEQLQGKMEEWITLIKQGHLPTHFVWTSYTHQL